VSYPTPVISVTQVEFPSQFEWAHGEFLDRAEDAYWARFVTKPFTWARFYAWWVARRFISPRDIRKR
jgi:hypothetical protein